MSDEVSFIEWAKQYRVSHPQYNYEPFLLARMREAYEAGAADAAREATERERAQSIQVVLRRRKHTHAFANWDAALDQAASDLGAALPAQDSTNATLETMERLQRDYRTIRAALGDVMTELPDKHWARAEARKALNNTQEPAAIRAAEPDAGKGAT